MKMSSSKKRSDVLVPCLNCQKLLTRSNLQRHLKLNCPAVLGRDVSGSVEPSSRDVSESPSRGRSHVKSGARRRGIRHGSSDSPWPPSAGCREPRSRRRGDSVSSTSSVATCEEKVSSATIEKATLAILDRHDEYSQDALCAFLARCYPTIPAVCMKVLVVAAASGARSAAQLHGLVARNNRSENVAFKKFAIGAADVLDCWGLGLNPPHRAGRTFERHQRINAEAGAKPIAAAEGAAPRSEASPATEARVRNALASKFLPVPMPLQPLDFNPRDDLMSQAMADAGLENIVTRYDVCDLTQRSATNEEDLASASKNQEARRELQDSERRGRGARLLRIGSAVLGHSPPAAANCEEHMETNGDELASASKTREVYREFLGTEQRSREAYLMEIGSAVLGHSPPTVANREEPYEPVGVSGAEMVVPDYVPTPVSINHAATGQPVITLSESDADDNNNIVDSGSLTVPVETSDAMSMINAAVLAAEMSMRAGVSDAPLVVDTDAQPSPAPVLAVVASRDAVNSGVSSTSSGSKKRKPSAEHTEPPAAKRSSPTSSAAVAKSAEVSTTNQPAAKGGSDPMSAPKIASTNDPRRNESVKGKSSVGGGQTISGPDSPAASGGCGVRDARPTSGALTDATGGGSKSPSTSSAARADRADKSVGAPGNAGAEKRAPRKESTDDRYNPDTGLRLPVKTKSSADKTTKSTSAESAASQPVDIVLTASDMDDDASQPDRSKSVRSAVVLVRLSSLEDRSKDEGHVADGTTKSDRLTTDPMKGKKSGRSSSPKESSQSRSGRKETSSSKDVSTSKEQISTKSKSGSKDRPSSGKPTSGTKECSSSDKRASKSPSRSSHRDDRRSRSRGKDDRRRSPSPFFQMTVPRAAREAMQKVLDEHNRRSKH